MKNVLMGCLLVFGAVQAGLAAPVPVVGSGSGTWVNPQPAGSVVSGVGTSSFQWGSTVAGSVDNILSFTGNSFSTVSLDPFKVGSLYYQNGSISGPGAASSVDLRVDIGFTTPGVGHVVGDYTFTINNTNNTDDPVASADFVTFPSNGLATSNSAFFNVGNQTYSLQLAGFSNVIGDGFLQSTDMGFHVEEQGHAVADLMAVVRPVPEPSSYALLLTGLALVFGVSHRRKSGSHSARGIVNIDDAWMRRSA